MRPAPRTCSGDRTPSLANHSCLVTVLVASTLTIGALVGLGALDSQLFWLAYPLGLSVPIALAIVRRWDTRLVSAGEQPETTATVRADDPGQSVRGELTDAEFVRRVAQLFQPGPAATGSHH